MTPTDDRVLVKIVEERITPGGIHLPDNAEPRHTGEAVVMSAGPGRLLEDGSRMPMQVRRGDLVYCSTQVGFEIEMEGERYRMIRETDIFAVEI